MSSRHEVPHHLQSEQAEGRGRRPHWLRNAFSVEDPADFTPTEEQKELVEDTCRWMIRRGLTTAALIGVEMHRPANYILANVMHFFRPTVSLTLPLLHLLPIIRRALPDMTRYRAFAEMIEHRGAADYFVKELERIEAEVISTPDDTSDPSNSPSDPPSKPSREHDEQD